MSNRVLFTKCLSESYTTLLSVVKQNIFILHTSFNAKVEKEPKLKTICCDSVYHIVKRLQKPISEDFRKPFSKLLTSNKIGNYEVALGYCFHVNCI